MSYPWVDKYSRYGIEPEDYDDDSVSDWDMYPEDEESPFPDDNGEEYDIPTSEDES